MCTQARFLAGAMFSLGLLASGCSSVPYDGTSGMMESGVRTSIYSTLDSTALVYTNPAAAITDFAHAHPLSFHFAVTTPHARAERTRLEQAGATCFVEEAPPDGSVLIMMRDPWGVPLQLCQRTTPFPATP